MQAISGSLFLLALVLRDHANAKSEGVPRQLSFIDIPFVWGVTEPAADAVLKGKSVTFNTIPRDLICSLPLGSSKCDNLQREFHKTESAWMQNLAVGFGFSAVSLFVFGLNIFGLIGMISSIVLGTLPFDSMVHVPTPWVNATEMNDLQQATFSFYRTISNSTAYFYGGFDFGSLAHENHATFVNRTRYQQQFGRGEATVAALWYTFTGKETNTKITTESQWWWGGGV